MEINFSCFAQDLLESLWELNRKVGVEYGERNLNLDKMKDCRLIVQKLGEFLVNQAESLLAGKESRMAAELRVKELTEGLRETMVLFKEREESFDSLAGISKDQGRKVRNKRMATGEKANVIVRLNE